MAIDRFNTERFETFLPKGRWVYEGMQGNERVYRITPTGAPDDFAIRIRSSIGADGWADEAGEDSIRCVIVRRTVDVDGGEHWNPYGGKYNRWTDRRNGWEDRLGKVLASLKTQVLRLDFPCPCCDGELVPFTAQKGKPENKGRPYVKCCNEQCITPYGQWTDTGEVWGSKADTVGAPKCPDCGAGMVRMTSDKGFRCNVSGNKPAGKGKGKNGGFWSLCNGVVWDRDRKAVAVEGASPDDTNDDEPPPARAPTIKPQAAPVKPAPAPTMEVKLPPPPAFTPPPSAPAPAAPAAVKATPLQVLVASVRKAMVTLRDEEVPVTPALLAQLRNCVSPEALEALRDLLQAALNA